MRSGTKVEVPKEIRHPWSASALDITDITTKLLTDTIEGLKTK